MITRPMLAAKLSDPGHLRFPCLATPKLDGIRCLIVGGRPLSRSFKPIRNRHIVSCLADLPDGLDGELMADGGFNVVTSAVMREAGEPKFKYWVFDWYDEYACYERRMELVSQLLSPCIVLVLPTLLSTPADFDEYYANAVAMGYEGVVTRSPGSPYVCRRSTPREQYMVKHKEWSDGEAVVIGFKEAMENTNDVSYDHFGYTKRPGGRRDHAPKGTLGSFLVRDVASGAEFGVGGGPGLDAALRQAVWDTRDSYLGKLIKYRYQSHGTVDKPRFPQFVGFRHPEDM